MSTTINKATIWEDTGAVLMARIHNYDDTYIMQADLSSITYSIFNTNLDPTDAGYTVVDESGLTISSVIFDTLQTDNGWSPDTTGYNFKMTIGDDVFTTGNTNYLVEITFNQSSTPRIKVPFDIYAKPIAAS